MNKLTCLLQETKKHFGMKLRTVESMCAASSNREYARQGRGLNFYPQTQADAASFLLALLFLFLLLGPSPPPPFFSPFFLSNCRAPTMGQIL